MHTGGPTPQPTPAPPARPALNARPGPGISAPLPPRLGPSTLTFRTLRSEPPGPPPPLRNWHQLSPSDAWAKILEPISTCLSLAPQS